MIKKIKWKAAMWDVLIPKNHKMRYIDENSKNTLLLWFYLFSHKQTDVFFLISLCLLCYNYVWTADPSLPFIPLLLKALFLIVTYPNVLLDIEPSVVTTCCFQLPSSVSCLRPFIVPTANLKSCQTNDLRVVGFFFLYLNSWLALAR